LAQQFKLPLDVFYYRSVDTNHAFRFVWHRPR